MTIRPATAGDVDALYALGLATPELQVSQTEPFMEPDEFRNAVLGADGVCLLADDGARAVGFVYASTQDMEKSGAARWACLVYLAVEPLHRRHGVAGMLHDGCVAALKARGVKKLYGWANAESDGAIVAFMKKHGFAEGHRYVWMDKEL